MTNGESGRANQSAFLDPKANFRSLVGGVALIATLWLGYSIFVGQDASLKASVHRPATIFEAIRKPETILDETIIIEASGSQSRCWTFESPQSLSVVVTGKAETAKGFSAFFAETAEVRKFEKGDEFRYVSSLSGRRISEVRGTSTVAGGAWCLVISNTENIVRAMTVQAKVVRDPRTEKP